MKVRGQAITRPSVELSVVISERDLRDFSTDFLMVQVERMVRLHIEAAKRHYEDVPPIEFVRAVEETNQLTEE